MQKKLFLMLLALIPFTVNCNNLVNKPSRFTSYVGNIGSGAAPSSGSHFQ